MPRTHGNTTKIMRASKSCAREISGADFDEILNDFEIALDNLQKWIDQLPGNTYKEKEDKKDE